MADKNRTRLDERLADFTDRLLAGENPDQPVVSGSDRDLEALQETVRRAGSALHVEAPDAELRNRIRLRLAAEWQRSGPSAQGDQKGWLPGRKRNQVLLLRFAGFMVVLLILAGIFAPRIGAVLPGAAQNTGGWAILIGAGLLVLVLILYFSIRKP